jgi:hypothetical protein
LAGNCNFNLDLSLLKGESVLSPFLFPASGQIRSLFTQNSEVIEQLGDAVASS